jgi:hypothetical protein
MPRKSPQSANHQAVLSRLAEILPKVQHPVQRHLLALGQSYLSHGQLRKAQAAIWSASETEGTACTLQGELEAMAREVRV